jgi:NADH-quinone oxidoreductase subunit J
MTFKLFVFYMLAALLVFAAIRVITARNPVHCALFLVLAFVSCSGLWLLLEAEFLAIALVLVYVGAVMVLFLFVVMMLDINLARMREGLFTYLPLGLTVAALMVLEMGLVLWARNEELQDMALPPPPLAADYSNTKELGRLLYTEYVYPFELAAVILLVAIVAAIALTLRRRKNTRYQNPSLQVSVRREDRIRLVSMPPVRREAQPAAEEQAPGEAKPEAGGAR